MRYLLLATDYDGTLACDGKVDDRTLEALRRLRATGRQLVLATGRHLPDLCEVFPEVDLFDRVVAENGGLVYQPATREEKLLCEPPDPRFVSLLREREIPISLGRTIVATWQPHDAAVLGAIRDLGLDLQVNFNKGAVMVLPSGVNKGSGFKAALDELGISPHNVVAVGDAENDHSFLRLSGCGVAVANALPSLKERADVVLEAPRGAGVTDLIERLIADDLLQFEPKLRRNLIALGQQVNDNSRQIFVGPRDGSLLVAGPSASGKSTTVSGILEQLVHSNFQFCLMDPEGDYEDSPGVLAFGTANEPPDTKAVLRALEFPQQSVLVNLLGVPLDARPAFTSLLLPSLQELRLRRGRPHWIVLDEAHHLLPSSGSPAPAGMAQVLENAIFITVHPEHIAESALDTVSVLITVGKSPMETIRLFCNVVHAAPPEGPELELATGEALVWFRRRREPPAHVRAIRSTRERRRHVRLYAEGELSPEQSFYFRGRDLALNLRAQNLKTFLQLAEGVDDDTWMYHLHRRDYSAWFKSMIKDDELAQYISSVEEDPGASPQESRERIREAITNRYTAPA